MHQGQPPHYGASDSEDGSDSEEVQSNLGGSKRPRDTGPGQPSYGQPNAKRQASGQEEFPNAWGKPAGEGQDADQGGLGGNAPYKTDMDKGEMEECRKLKAQIAHICQMNPKVDIHAQPRIQSELQGLNAEELKNVLFNVKQQTSGVSPYASSQGLAGFIGIGIEKKMEHPGYAQALRADVDFIAAIDDMIGSKLSAFGAPIQFAYSLINAYFTTLPTSSQHDPIPAAITNVSHGTFPNGENDFRGEAHY